MKDLIKRYWDIIGGIFSALGICVLVDFDIQPIQLAYSIIILSIVCIGLLRFIKESIEKRKRVHNIVDSVVDAHKPIKAIEIINNPGKPGKELGKTFILTIKEVSKGMEKFKNFLSRSKGYLLAGLLFILGFIEGNYPLINDLVGGYLVINDIEILPIIFLVGSLVVAGLSNNFDGEEWKIIVETIKAVRESKKNNKALNDELKKIIKDNESILKSAYKELTKAEQKLASAESTLSSAQSSLEVKEQLYISKIIPVSEYNIARDVVTLANEEVHKELKEVERLNKQVGELEIKIEELKSKKV